MGDKGGVRLRLFPASPVDRAVICKSFGEIDIGKIAMSQGMNITFCTTARTDGDARALLTHLGLPLRRAEA